MFCQKQKVKGFRETVKTIKCVPQKHKGSSAISVSR